MKKLFSYGLISFLIASTALGGTSGIGTGESATYHRAGGSGGSSGSTQQYPVLNVVRPPYNADNTGVTDPSTAIQTAIDTCDRTNTHLGCAVYLPCGTYSTRKALRVRSSNTRIFGDGFCSFLSGGGTGMTALVVGPDWNGIPTTTSISPGGSPLAWDWSTCGNNYVFELSQTPLFQQSQTTLNGFHSIQVVGRYKPRDNGGPYYLIQSWGSRTVDETQNSAFYVEDSSQTMIAHIQLSGSGSVTCQKSGVFTSAATVEFEMNWDDTTNTMRGFKDGTAITWDSCVGGIGPTSLSGTLVQKPWEDVTIGTQYNGWRYQQTNGNGPCGTLGGDVQLRYNNSTFFHTSNYSVNTPIPHDNGTLWDLNPLNQVTYTGAYASNTYEVNNHAADMIMWRTDDGSALTEVEIDHLRISSYSAGIIAFSTIRLNAHHLALEGMWRDGIRCKDNCYGSTIDHIEGYTADNGAAVIGIEQTGLVDVSDVYVYGANCPVAVAGGSIWGNNIYATPNVNHGFCDIYISGHGFGNQFTTIRAGSIGNEIGLFNSGAPVILESLVGAYIEATDFQSQYPDVRPAAFLLMSKGDTPHGFPVTLINPRWDSGSLGANPTTKISLIGSWDRASVNVIGPQDASFTGSMTLSDHPEYLNVLDVGYFSSQTPTTLFSVYPNAVAGAATYGGHTLPAHAYTVTDVAGYVSSAASGAGTTTVRISDGTNNCDAAFDCAADTNTTGAKTKATTGTCIFAASAALTVSVNATTCGTTQPTFKNLDVQGKWQN